MKIKKIKQAVGLVGNIVDTLGATGDSDVPNAKTIKNYIDNNFINTTLTEPADANTLLNTGFYRMTDKAENMPYGSLWVLMVIRRTSTGVIQVAFRNSNYEVYIRNYNNSSGMLTWTPWKKLLTEDTIEQKSVCTVYLSSDYSIKESSTYEKLNLSMFGSNGSKLSVSNGGIKIGKGVSKILVSCDAVFQNIAGEGQKYVTIYKNANAILHTNTYATRERVMLSKAPTLLEVSENDIIYLYIYGSKDDVLQTRRCFLTVEAL